MKFYESHYEEYIDSMNKYNLHPELSDTFNSLPANCSQMGNLILYGPSGAGKYTQSLAILKRYSATELKYDKKITIQTEKQDYMYHISDIHYEIDMSLLGCNSKILWRELFSQIVDIISVKNEKYGFILCKNFHAIHAELLEVFYSYIQQYSHHKSPIKIHFILLTEHISFIPNNIIQACQLINIARPTKSQYENISVPTVSQPGASVLDNFSKKIGKEYERTECNDMNMMKLFEQIKSNEILNCKEVKSFSSISTGKIPKDIFNIVCDNIINEMTSPSKLSYATFRDAVYDMLVYNLDVAECIWYILYFFIQNQSIKDGDLSDVLDRCYVFLKYYNNNYRPIYHLESILFYFIIKIRRYEC
jgi:hypothetical protein